jgi:hypothetical protein
MSTTTLQTSYTYFYQIIQINDNYDPTIPEDDPDYIPVRYVLFDGIDKIEDAIRKHNELVPGPGCTNIIGVRYEPGTTPGAV